MVKKSIKRTEREREKEMKERMKEMKGKKMLKLWSADFVCQLIVNELWLLILETLLIFFGVRFLEEDCKGLNEEREKERKKKKEEDNKFRSIFLPVIFFFILVYLLSSF